MNFNCACVRERAPPMGSGKTSCDLTGVLKEEWNVC